MQPLEQLGGPILAYGLRNPLNQFLAIGLHPLCLAFCLLVVHDIHKNLFSYFSIDHLEDAQNQTIICDNHSITLFVGASIITTRKRTFLAAFVGKLDFSSREDPTVREHESRQTDNKKKERGGIEHMDITRSGSQPSGKAPAEYFTGAVRIDPLFQAPDIAIQERLDGKTVDWMEPVSDEHYQS